MHNGSTLRAVSKDKIYKKCSVLLRTQQIMKAEALKASVEEEDCDSIEALKVMHPHTLQRKCFMLGGKSLMKVHHLLNNLKQNNS